jgi:hypothetical protein
LHALLESAVVAPRFLRPSHQHRTSKKIGQKWGALIHKLLKTEEAHTRDYFGDLCEGAVSS